MLRAVLFIAFLSAYGYCQANLQLNLEHSLDGRSFTTAGNISGHITKRGTVSEHLILIRKALSSAQRKAFEQLAKQDGFYTIRVSPNWDATATNGAVSTSVRAMCLVLSDFREDIRVAWDVESSSPLSVQYRLLGYNCEPGNSSLLTEKLFGQWDFPRRSDVLLEVAQVAWPVQVTGGDVTQAPEKAAAAAKTINKATESGEGGETPPEVKDERTWLQKNWMMVVLVGVMILNMVMKGMGEAAPGPGAPGPAAAQAPARAARQR